MLVAIALGARAIDDRLVIAGDETVRRAERRDADRAEVLLEEGARLAGLLGFAATAFWQTLNSAPNIGWPGRDSRAFAGSPGSS